VVAKRFGLGAALRAASRDRAVVELADVDGRLVTGTIDVVGADHLELAEHAADEARRSANVTGRLIVPFWSLGSVRRIS
jgi:prophage tail gpP-like protein